MSDGIGFFGQNVVLDHRVEVDIARRWVAKAVSHIVHFDSAYAAVHLFGSNWSIWLSGMLEWLFRNCVKYLCGSTTWGRQLPFRLRTSAAAPYPSARAFPGAAQAG